jgi:hypothetical protein
MAAGAKGGGPGSVEGAEGRVGGKQRFDISQTFSADLRVRLAQGKHGEAILALTGQ